MIPVLILSFIVRLINLNQSLWLDEAIEALAVKNNSFIELVSRYAVFDYSPPLYHVILKAWTNIFGYSEISLRLPSVVFGVLTVALVFLIAKKLFNHKVAFLAGTFLALNPLAVYYSQEARRYSLAALAITASVYFFLQKKWFWFGLALLIALYTDYLTWFMIPIFFLLKKKTAIIFIFLLPAIFLLREQLAAGMQLARDNPLWSQVVGGFDFKSIPLTFVKFIFGRITIDNKIFYAAIFGPVALFYLWILSEAKNKILWLWLAIPIILGAIISVKIPIFSYFRFLFILPAFCLLLAEGTKTKKVFVIFIIFINFISIIIFNLNPRFQREDWRSAVAYMEKSSSKVFIPSLAQADPIYYYRKNLVIRDKENLVIGPENTVFLIRYVREIFDQRDFLKKVLELSGYQKVEEKSFNGVVIWKYENRN